MLPRALPAPEIISPEKRMMESWDTLMCCGKTYELWEQAEQVDARYWETRLPEEDDGF